MSTSVLFGVDNLRPKTVWVNVDKLTPPVSINCNSACLALITVCTVLGLSLVNGLVLRTKTRSLPVISENMLRYLID